MPRLHLAQNYLYLHPREGGDSVTFLSCDAQRAEALDSRLRGNDAFEIGRLCDVIEASSRGRR